VVKAILCYSEDTKRLPEIITYANRVADTATIIAAVKDEPEAIRSAFEYGASKVYTASAETLGPLDASCAADVLYDLCRKEAPDLIVLAATKFGKETAARLAAKLDAPLGTECRSFRFSDGKLEVERTVFSGNGLATEALSKLPAVVTLQSGIVEPQRKPSQGETERVGAEYKALTETLEVKRKGGATAIKLEEAERIVAVGRGLQRKEDLELIKQLADALQAAVGGSRPLAADLGWLSDDQWIGLSGHKVKPKLYVAIGISGQVQHIAGIRDSKVIVAINKDPNAPMASNSDYYVVGDLYKIVPELIKQLKQRV
jgi:electron transfer flavoprotein alpha subunit